MRRSLALVLITLAVVAGVAVVAEAAPERERQPLPNLELRTLDGTVVETDAFRGRPVLLTFWASWCGPCRVELPHLEELYAELAGKGFVVLTVNVDRTPAAAERFLAATGIDLPVYRLSPQTLAALGIDSLPTNILIDPQGIPDMVVQGYEQTMPSRIRRRVLAMVEDGD